MEATAVKSRSRNRTKKKAAPKQKNLELESIQIASEALPSGDERDAGQVSAKELSIGEKLQKEKYSVSSTNVSSSIESQEDKHVPSEIKPSIISNVQPNESISSVNKLSDTSLIQNSGTISEAAEQISLESTEGSGATHDTLSSNCSLKLESKQPSSLANGEKVPYPALSGNLGVTQVTSIYPQLSELYNVREQHSVVFKQTSESLVSCTSKVYPALETISVQQDLIVSQALVKTYTKAFESKAMKDAQKGYQEFIQEQIFIEKHEFFDLVRKYERVRQEFIDTQKKLKSNEYKLKRKKNDLWKSASKKAVAKGKCEDGNTVDICHSYDVKEFKDDAINEITEIFHELEENLLADLAFYSYMDQLTRLQMDLYIYDLLTNSVTFADKTSSTPLAAYVLAMPPKQYMDEISALKKCISILFSFQRKPNYDSEFINYTRDCLSNLVALLLRSGRLEDNLFIINHVLRCPSGISTWASGYIQLPLPPLKSEPTFQTGSFESEYLDYSVAVLYMLMSYPVPERDTFLKYIKLSSMVCSMTACPDLNFVVLDSEGEEVEEPVPLCKEWTEEDIIALLNQIPTARIFQYILLFSSTDEYSVHRTTEEGMQKLLAFSTFLIDIFRDGLKAYSNLSYVILASRIGRLMRHTVHYVSDHWQNYKEVNSPVKCGLQAEFDRFFFHAVYSMFSIPETGAWKFLSGLPYENVSPRMLWNLLWIFHSTGIAEEEELVYAEKDVDMKLKSDVQRQFLQENLSKVSLEGSLHLLNALEKMSSPDDSDKEFVCCVAREILETSIFSDQLYDELAKEGRVLISSIVNKHPYVISLLIKEIDEKDEKAASTLLSLFKEISLLRWIPDPSDLQKISDWLLSGSLSSPKNRIARLILEKLNWGNNNEPGNVVLPIELHRQVGVLVTQAYVKYDGSGDTWSVSKGIDQMLNLYAAIRCQSVESDQGFVSWAWEMLFSLKLHVLDHPNPPWVEIYDGKVETDSIPDIHRDTWLHPLLRAMEDKTPAGAYLALVMTNIGHSLKNLAKEGLEIIATLVEQKQYAAAIHLLYYTFPFFAKSPELLTSNERFMLQMYELTVADQSCFSIGSGPVVGTVLQNIVTMIKHQVFQAWKLTVECANPILKLWVQVLVKLLLLEEKMGLRQKLRGGSNQVYYLLDVVVQIAFGDNHTREGIVDLMSSITKPVLSSPNGTNKTTLWNLVFGGDQSSSLLPSQSLPDYPWFAWCVLVSECSQKQTQDLWLSVINEMSLDTGIGVEMALKKASSAVRIYSPPLLNLPVYRWCLQAIDTPVSHPILPLLWQQFFLYFLQRTTNTSGVKECNSVGQRFFVSGAHVKIFQNAKARLKEAADYFHTCVENTGGKLENLYRDFVKQNSDRTSLKVEERKLRDDLGFYQELLFTFRAFVTWMDDPDIHKSSVCLPALEPRHYSHRLKLIIQNDQIPWMELIRIDQLKEKLENNGHIWPQCRKKPSTEVVVVDKHEICQMTPTQKIRKRLKSYEEPQPLPPVKPLEPPVGEISDNMLASWDVLSKIVHSDQRIIWDQAKKFGDLLRKVRHLDSVFMNWAPKEYQTQDHVVVHRKPCFKGTKDCAGPAVFRLTIQRSKRNEKVQEKLEQNRIDYQLVLKEIMKPPPPELCSAAMHMENCVRALVKKIKASKGQQPQVLRNMGISLFYLQVELTEKALVSVADYSPFRQFFSSSIELLGREFIEDEEGQCLPLSKVLLKNPAAAGMASPFFNPNNASPNTFLDVYDVLVKSVRSSAPSAIIMMLSKIDLHKWLTEKKVAFPERKKLFTKIGKALINCGREPKDDFLSIYELFKKHFRALLLHQFPDHYDDVIHLLLSELERKELNVDIWYETFRCLGCSISTLETSVQEIQSSLQKFALNQHLSADQQLFVFTQPLQLNQVMNTVQYFNRYFLKIRQTSPSGLYKQYKGYVRPVAIFLGMMGHCMMDFYSSRNFIVSDKALDLDGLWKALHVTFCLWLDPDVKENRLLFPWDQEDEDDASFMFQMFASCLGFHHKQLFARKCQRSILSYVWNYYVTIYVSPGLRNYSTVVCHSTLLQLPWHEFHPSAEDIHGMCTVLRSEIPESRDFLARLSMKIPWFDVMGHVTETDNSAAAAKTFSVLGELLIISAWEFSVIKTNSHKGILKTLENLSWYVLSPEMVGVLLDLYSTLADPLKLLKNADDVADVYLLKFLKIVCVMVPEQPNQLHSTEKRLLYLSMYAKLLGTCVQENVDAVLCCEEQFSLVLPTLLKEVESIVLKDAAPSEQVNCAMPLVREALGLLNYVTDCRLQPILRNSVTAWLSASPKSPLLLPCLKTACCSLTSVHHMVAIVECCITSRFDTELEDPSEATTIWYLLSSCFQVPPGMHDEFLIVCLERNAYLTLFNYVLHRLPQSSTEAAKVMLLQNMVDWLKRTKPAENCEAKMLLLWDKICEMSLKLASENEQVVQNYLIAFCGVLNQLGEDRSRSGIWAAVGLGKQSPLSVNFRFLCRAMAAYLLLQMPEKGSLRLELMAPGFIPQANSDTPSSSKRISYDSSKPHPSASAIKALENLKNLTCNKSYSALKGQVDCATSYCLNPRYCLLESRNILKELALQVFPNHAYLHVLDTQV